MGDEWEQRTFSWTGERDGTPLLLDVTIASSRATGEARFIRAALGFAESEVDLTDEEKAEAVFAFLAAQA